MTVETTDWELLNAHADGELGQEESAFLRQRIAIEPELAAEFARIMALKSNLSVLRPATAVSEPDGAVAEGAATASAAPERRTRRVRTLMGTAAVLVLLTAGIAYGPYAPGKNQRMGIGPIHAAFSERTYFIDVDRQVLVSAGTAIGDLDAPDLSASNLTLVDVQTYDGTARIAMHYRGRRGCRVTLVVDTADSTPFSSPDAAALVYLWQTGTRQFALIAEGMDELRFAAIGNFAEAQTRASEHQQEFRTALIERTEHARPCA